MNKLYRDLESRSLLKVIAGINNFDKARVLRIVKVAEAARASIVDIAADAEIIEAALDLVQDTKICVSAIKSEELLMAQALGAHMLELGNYEALHEQGIYPSAEQVLAWAQEVLEFKNHKVMFSVTVPGHLDIAEQVRLAQDLEALGGVDLIQTEGAALVQTNKAAALGQIEKVKLTLASTIEITKALETTKVMTASGITPDTAKLAIAAGACGIGVGKYINKLETGVEMLAAIKALQQSLGLPQSVESPC